jgi:transposase
MEIPLPKKSPFRIDLTEAERRILEGKARKYTSSYIDVVRAKIVLYAAEELENQDIAARLDTSAQIVCKWRKRFFEQRLDGLEEAPRRGRPPRFSPRTRR